MDLQIFCGGLLKSSRKPDGFFIFALFEWQGCLAIFSMSFAEFPNNFIGQLQLRSICIDGFCGPVVAGAPYCFKNCPCRGNHLFAQLIFNHACIVGT